MNGRITNIILPIFACIAYVGIDFVYVYLVKDRYAKVVEDIQHSKMEVDFVAAIFCYLIMAVGWYFITVQLAEAYFERLKQRSTTWPTLSSSALSGLVAGFLYGFVVYGVYNCTTRTIFSNGYPVSLLVQDMAWGSLFNMVYTSLYMLIWHKLRSPADL